MRFFGKTVVLGLAVIGILQFVRPSIPTGPAGGELQTTPEVKQILAKDCYSCHSDQRRLAWFDQIVPAYWLVRHDILTARKHLNFSTLGSKPIAMQSASLYEAVNMIQLGAMPLSDFVKLHPESKVTPEELAALKGYLAPWSSVPPQTAHEPLSVPVSLTTVAPELNGLAFDGAFEDWKVLSTTDRGDNNTFRFIVGNDVAMKAAQAGNISPWPDGARFGKIAWQKELGPDGRVYPGKFVQVELMVKSALLYKDTEGWGWGRWRGRDLKPYGNNAQFVKECTGCHQPLQGNDFVYTLPISSAKVGGAEIVNNVAALPSNLPYQPLAWNAITMYVDPKTRTTAILFGNDVARSALQVRRANAASAPTVTVYPAGTVLSLVTWTQRDDPHWFGARIPDVPKALEFVQVLDGDGQISYRNFSGPGLAKESSEDLAGARTNFLLNLTPAVLP